MPRWRHASRAGTRTSRRSPPCRSAATPGCSGAAVPSRRSATDLPEGVVTKGAVYEVMPFENTIFTLELTAAEVRRALEDGLRSGRVTQVSGIRYEFDNSRPRGDRVVSVTLADGKPLDDAKLYKVGCNNFMATGGDDNAVLSQGKNRADTGRNVRDVLETYIAARSKNGGTLDCKLDGRVKRSGGDGR
ncbi:MAG: hypothetical protein E6K72_03515 [Candidatus Eisenbacteria bacterium]|uniref:5'-Nucleotidase C-terminal domain-containing protein n=1 Tax=Eiseniibacteriota bacterium TaxID=2212470 RepID=A0A538T205_UNCEI|nr:MAG: hypothetical protein E6K72_03515 [Candidatus Eisenbacteria bacterium]